MILTSEPTVNVTLKDFKMMESATETLEKMLYNPDRKFVVGRMHEVVYYIPISDDFAMDMENRLRESQEAYEKLRRDYRNLQDQIASKK